MTLIVAADVQDHLILAGDHCAVLSRVSNQGAPDLVLDNYRKVYPWKYGAIAASGDVFLMAYFYSLFFHHEAKGRPIDLLQVARQAKAARSRNGIPADISTGNLFFTLPGDEGFGLHSVSIEEDRIEHETIEPISAHFSTREEGADMPVYLAFIRRLRPSFFFDDAGAFHRYHLDLLDTLFAGQSAIDDRVTASFDVCMLDKKTGMGLFWQRPEATRRCLTLRLQPDEAAVAVRNDG